MANVKLILSLIKRYNTFCVASEGVLIWLKGGQMLLLQIFVMSWHHLQVNFDIMLAKYLDDQDLMEFRSKLDRYLSEVCIQKYSILMFWIGEWLIPSIIMSLLRQHIMCQPPPFFIIASEFAFSTIGCILDLFMILLSLDTIKSLICI